MYVLNCHRANRRHLTLEDLDSCGLFILFQDTLSIRKNPSNTQSYSFSFFVQQLQLASDNATSKESCRDIGTSITTNGLALRLCRLVPMTRTAVHAGLRSRLEMVGSLTSRPILLLTQPSIRKMHRQSNGLSGPTCLRHLQLLNLMLILL